MTVTDTQGVHRLHNAEVYHVGSQTTTQIYLVVISGKAGLCTCPARTNCNHIRRAMATRQQETAR